MNSVDRQSGRNPIKDTASHLLLVEGKDEERFFSALLESELSGSVSECQVIALGKNRFRPRLQGLAIHIRGSSVRSIGVVRDADEHPAGALQSVCDALAAADFPKPGLHGAIVETNPRVGVFVMPDGHSPGALEALCRQSAESEPAGSCVLEYLDCLKKREGWGDGTERNTAQRDKAFVHAYLASREDPVARTGEGAQQGVWNFRHEAFRPVTEFLRKLTAESSGDALSQG